MKTVPQPSMTRGRLRLFRLHPGYLILALVLALFAYTFIQKTREVSQLSAQESALRAANAQTAGENRSMERAIRYYHTSSYVATRARALLGYARPGDVIVEVQPRYGNPVVRAAPPRPAPTPLPVWRQWVNSFSR